MKYTALLISIVLLAVACKKDKPQPAENHDAENLVKGLNGQVAKIDSLSSFAPYLKDLELNNADAAQGVTVFAPVNSAFNDPGGRKAAGNGELREALPDSTDVQDYVVKGIINTSALTDNAHFTTLNGKTLTITKTGDNLRVNGILLTGKQGISGDKTMIYTINGLLKKSPSLVITVWDATQWSATQPRGAVAGGATVALYRSREDYASNAPAYTAETDLNGKAKFSKVDAGVYFIVATKGDMSNILKDKGFWNPQPVGGLLAGYGFDSVFQTTAEVAASPQQPNGAPGNFRLWDANADGRIDNNDFVALPYTSVKAEQGLTATRDVLIGYSNNNNLKTIPDLLAAKALLQGCYSLDATAFLNFTMMDSYLSDNADATAAKWQAIDNFTFTPQEPIFTSLWNSAYLSALPQLNRIIRDVPGLPDATEKATVIAEAKYLRAYIYLQLFTYFGNVPILNGVVLPPDLSNTDGRQKAYQQVMKDLDEASTVLPAQWPQDQAFRPTKGAVTALAARTALVQKDYKNAAIYAQSVLNSGNYQLLPSYLSVFTTAPNAEVIWDLSDRMQMPEFNAYFIYGGLHGNSASSRCPTIRLAEMYLIAAEGLLEQPGGGVTADVVNYINRLSLRLTSSQVVSTNNTIAQVRNALRNIWQQEMLREGNRFVCLQRWGMAQLMLGAKGYTSPKNELLPIPADYMNSYSGMMQNVGY
ncbi:putative surface protein with fasciclin (FAS1) repeats [Chitinophaga terrae (ex Kim and Jung 2007)]|uniref:RagB/SusD family nutrient uptake outer membrane protein n=1 Tax=Chitinophaga terrae (ex Kim and Jung 2007) TaxID=408074 RepID=UPI002789E65B|nr:RagB/SusD family nutrient uptake outer membrane protein [Chitinophaga terrae (ex Kim and Jung 2007)]MDQ0106087.1 putative surface protein with fasciclin (FAS1) repeats [Chitinophaga terrae (ex Kim and Jung 2007)]